MGSVAAGLTSTELRDVRVEQDGVIIVAQQVSATYSAMDYISGRRITIENVAVKGLEIDARKPTPKQSTAPAQVALAPFAGILNSIKLPGEMSLGRLDVDAKVQLPGNQSATLTLSGGGITPGKFATITWKAAFADLGKGAPLTAAQASGEIKLRTTADLRVDALEISGDASATGPSIPSDRVKLEVKLAQVDAKSGETISALVGLVRGANVEPLFNTQVAFAAGKPTLSGTWGLAVRSEQLAAVLSGFGLPEVALAGEGSFSFNIETSAATAAGTLNGQVSKLEKLGAELAAIGTLQIRAAFDGGSGKDSAQLGKLEFAVAAPDGRKFVTVAAQQKLLEQNIAAWHNKEQQTARSLDMCAGRFEESADRGISRLEGVCAALHTATKEHQVAAMKAQHWFNHVTLGTKAWPLAACTLGGAMAAVIVQYLLTRS